MQSFTFGQRNDVVPVAVDQKERAVVLLQSADGVESVPHDEGRYQESSGHMYDAAKRRLQDNRGNGALTDERTDGTTTE